MKVITRHHSGDVICTCKGYKPEAWYVSPSVVGSAQPNQTTEAGIIQTTLPRESGASISEKGATLVRAFNMEMRENEARMPEHECRVALTGYIALLEADSAALNRLEAAIRANIARRVGTFAGEWWIDNEQGDTIARGFSFRELIEALPE